MVRLYRLLLLLLPGPFRREFGPQMLGVVAEHWQHARGRLGLWGRVGFWWRECMAVLREGVRLRRDWRNRTEGRKGRMEGLVQDIRYSLRSLVRQPGFTLVTILTLGLGIGATTAIFSAVHTVLLRDLPYAEADRIVTVFHRDLETGDREPGVSAANIRDLAEGSELLSQVAVAEPWSLDLQMEDRAETLRTWAVSGGFFQALGTDPLLGRAFTNQEYVDEGARVVVLGYRSWATRFGADPSLVGGTIQLDNEPYTVVGVLPLPFRFPDRAEAWIPRTPKPWDGRSRTADYMAGVGRLAPGTTLPQAQAEVDQLARALAESYPESNADLGFSLVPLREHLFGEVRTPLLVLLAAVAGVLIMACANVAGLLLARGAQRQREYALRSALGASGRRLTQHVVVDTLLLAGAGSILGLVLTYLGTEVIGALGADHLPRIEEMKVDGTVLVFGLLMGGVSAFLSGVAPSLRLFDSDLRAALGDGSRGSTVGRAQNTLRRRLVVAEVAGAMVILIGAGLLVKSFAVLTDRELGFDPANRVAVQVFAYGYGSPEDRLVFVTEVLRQMESVPGVEEVALTSTVPGANDGAVASIDIDVPFLVADQDVPPAGQEPVASISIVSPGFFPLMDIPLAQGRDFQATDHREAARVVLVNETLARRHFGQESPLGRRLVVEFGHGSSGELARDMEAGAFAEIVGVVRDVRPLGFDSEPRPEIYLPMAQGGDWGSLTFVARTAGDPEPLVLPLSEAIWEVNPAQSVWGTTTLESLMDDSLKERRFNLLLLLSFGVVSLILAAVGIYGLMNFSVEQRIGELGIRRALGGGSGDILGMVLREGTVLAGMGIVLGVVAALFLTRFLQGMLFGVQPTDPLTFGSLAVAVLLVASVAAGIPAFRATRVDPMDSLRRE